MSAGLSLTFLGAVDTVTGSRYLVESEGSRVLVDCGLFQGPKKLRLRNWAELPFDVERLDAVVLTHAHIDHAGYLPRLVKSGFTGPVYCTQGTSDLLQLLLPDAGHLQEEEAEHANRGGYSKHAPALPLYTREEATQCLDALVPVDFHRDFEPAPGVTARFARAGHIIGSGSLRLTTHGTSIGFSGDVGRPRDPIMMPPEPLDAADVLVVESTYGDRLHPTEDVAETLARVVIETIEKRGVIIVPSFAVGRSQHLLHLLAILRAERRIPECPIYLDSPLAIDATRVFSEHQDDHALSAEQVRRMCSVARYTQTADESRQLDRSSGPMIIVSASGMCTGGRVLHHLQRFLPDDRTTVLFVGYQAAGTRGRSLVDGTTELKMFGGYVPVKARVVQLDGLSAHADYAEMISWLRTSKVDPRRVFVTHGEPNAGDALRRRLHDAFGWDVRVPEAGEVVRL